VNEMDSGSTLPARGTVTQEAPIVNRARMDLRSILVTLLPLPLVAYFLLRFRPPVFGLMQVIGMALTVLGLVFLTAARLQLGHSFSVTPQARQLVTGGIYSRVRHPVYVFSALAIAGIMLYLRPIYLFALIPLILMQLRRARAEERVLEARFGDAYRIYRSKTWL
jgi:protein-S-isoprenylcysteine O-methyltransferase Ste14